MTERLDLGLVRQIGNNLIIGFETAQNVGADQVAKWCITSLFPVLQVFDKCLETFG